MPRVFISFQPYLALTLLCLALYLPGLAAVPPLDRDEARFAQATRQMVETGDLVRIHFQNTFRYKKPIGIHWLQAVAAITFDDPAAIWPYRLPSVIGALVAVLLTFYFGQVLLDRRTALLGAALLGSSLMLVIEAHQAKTDAVLLACVVGAQGALARFYWQAHASSLRHASSLLLSAPALGTALTFWLAQGIGVLVKGPIVPVVSGLTVVGLWGWERRWPGGWLLELRPLLGLVVMTVLVVPWFVAITFATNGAFFSEAVQADLLPKLFSAQESHGAPPGYFLLLAVLTFWPMSLFLWPALAYAWRHQRTVLAVRFCLAWSGPVWLLFEVVPTKLPHYILPVYPALALLIAVALLATEKEYPALLTSRGAYFWYGVWAVLTAALAGAFLVAPMVFGSDRILWGALPAGIVGSTGWLTVWLTWRRQFLTAMTIAGGGAGIAIIFVFAGLIPSLDALWLSQRVYIALGIAGINTNRHPVVVAGYHEPSLIFLLGTGTTLSDGKGAAAYLDATAAVAIVSHGEDHVFRLALAEHGLKPEQLFTIEGLNYSRGRRELLHLYIASRKPPHPSLYPIIVAPKQ